MSELPVSRLYRTARSVATGFALLLLFAASMAHAMKPPPPPRVQLADAWVEREYAKASGVVLDEFQGIPYAVPPLGVLRWQPPQSVMAWAEVRQAKRFGPRCMQLPLFGDMVFRSHGMSEDCLYVNIWKPAHASGTLPVMVYFFGGGFAGGDGSENRYDGASLASKDIVTVSSGRVRFLRAAGAG